MIKRKYKKNENFDLTEYVDGGCNFKIQPWKDESAESIIRRFSKRTKKERILQEVFDRRHYKKPSVLRREKESRRLFTIKKALEKESKDFQDKER